MSIENRIRPYLNPEHSDSPEQPPGGAVGPLCRGMFGFVIVIAAFLGTVLLLYLLMMAFNRGMTMATTHLG